MEEAVELFSMAFARVCALRVVDEGVVDSLTVGWRRLERWPCWGSGRVTVGADVVKDCSFSWLFLRLLESGWWKSGWCLRS
jgi:hypothetical protein